MTNPKKIAVFGSTGSIGTQALKIIEEHPDLFVAEILTANDNADLLIEQALRFQPNAVVIANESLYRYTADALKDCPVKVYSGSAALEQIAAAESIDVVLMALVGYSGLLPTVRAIKARKVLALANKETMVVAGSLIMDLVSKYGTPVIPVDSEHSAIFQCLAGEYSAIDRIYLTASGGPFLNTPAGELARMTKDDALKHPRWKMGAKITVDSATMMNKGFEVIEARWLFNVPVDRIQVLIHPQSLIHSMVQFEDGAIKAQLGEPDMKVPIQYSFTYPSRTLCSAPKVNFMQYAGLTFAEPDTEKFPCLKLAYQALRLGGTVPCIMNAANEVAVKAFLNGEIKYTDIYPVIAGTLEKNAGTGSPELSDCIETDAAARRCASDIVKHV